MNQWRSLASRKGTTYRAEFEETKALAESEAADNVGSHQRPPLEHIDDTIIAGTIVGDLINSKLNLLTNNVLKVLSDICFGEALCKQATTQAV
jgi:hypothetical protein